jgi:ribose 5-phosphate isomerase RpiB
MSDGIPDSLVTQIVGRVMAELARQVAPAPGAPKDKGNPPAGATGVPPRRGVSPRGGVAPVERPAGAPPAARVWLTADMLADRANGASAVAISLNEFLTPAARDYAAARGLEVRRTGGAEPPARASITILRPGRVAPAALTRTLGLVVSRPDAKVEAALAAVARGGVATRGFADSACWMVNARAMCQALVAGELAGGLIVERYAAAPLVLSGKVKGVRPVQGVSVAAVEAALRQFDANVLVIGHGAVSVYEMRGMIERFAAGRRSGRDRTLLLETLDEMEEKA